MNNFNMKNLVPHLIIVALFYIIATLFFLPALKGKVLQQSDFKSWQAMAHESIEYNKSHKDVALWSDNMFGGMPLYQTSMESKNNFIKYLQQLPLLMSKPPINTFFAMMLFLYIGLIVLGLGTYVSALAAVAMAFSTGNILLLEAGHLTKLAVISFATCTIAGIWVNYFKNRWAGLGLFAFGFGMQIVNNHVQMSYYLLLGIVPLFIIALVEAFKKSELPGFAINTALLGIVAILGFMCSATTILTTREYVKQTMRGGSVLSTSTTTGDNTSKSGLEWDYAMRWSNGVLDLVATIIPGVAGGGSGEKAMSNSNIKSALQKARIPVNSNTVVPGYWGELPFTGGPFYMGILLVLLFLMGIQLVEGKMRWWFVVSITLLSLMSMGRHFEMLNEILFNYLPFLNKFRAPSSILTIVALYLGIFGFFVLGKLIKNEFSQEAVKRSLLISGGVLGLICIFFWIVGPGFFDMSKGASGEEAKIMVNLREAMMTGDSLRSLLILAAGALLIYFANQGKLKPYVFLGGFGVLMLFDVFSINSRYISHKDFMSDNASNSIFQTRKVDDQILQDKTPGFRVFDATIDTYNSSIPTSYYHHTIGGYHPAKLRRYQDLIEHCLDAEHAKLGQILQNFSGNPADSNFIQSMSSLQVMNMLNTKYFILGEHGKEVALVNYAANGPAWFVNNIQWVSTPDEEIESLKKADLKHMAIIHNEWKDKAGVAGDGEGLIGLESYSPNELKYKTDANSDQIAVLSEIWYGPDLGWTASIDGKPADLFRVNYVLRGIRVPAGKHDIVLTFHPSSYFTGEMISAISSILMFAFLGLSLWMQWKKK